MNNPLVTVYITNHNYEQYVEKAIESVLRQTYNPIELIIIDDGSTDNSREIIEEYRSNSSIRIIYQENKGLNRTNNVAIREAKGKYIMRLDADDYLVPSAIGIMCAIMESEPELGLVFPDYYYINSRGEVTGEEYRQNFEREVSLYDLPAHGACTLIRMECLKEIGGYNEDFSCQDGYDLWIKFITHYEVSNVNKPLFYYRRHASNLTHNESKILAARKKIKEAFLKEYKITIPKTLAIMPIRDQYFNSFDWPLYKHNGETSIERTVRHVLDSKNVDKLVITSSKYKYRDFCRACFPGNKRVEYIKRPSEFEEYSVSLKPTLDLILEDSISQGHNFEILVTVAMEWPFITGRIIDDAINSLVIFGSDSIIGVRPDNATYFQHNGHGMKPILDQDKFTKYEREALYKRISGLTVSTIDNFERNGKMLSGKIGHIVLDEKSCISVKTEFDLKLFKNLVDELEVLEA